MKDKDNKIIYVGKASSIKNRVSQYFKEQDSPKTKVLVKNIDDIEYIVTKNEVEALILESNLIKENSPRYNVRLRDDKQYPYIKITSEEYPRICVVRKKEHDKGQYFGPYPNSKAIKNIIKIASSFGIRKCKKKLPCKPCLNYHIKQCSAPCFNKITKEEYIDIIKNVSEFLKGKYSKLIESLNYKMLEFSKIHEYEKAAHIRDLINSILELSIKQNVSKEGKKEQDIIGYSILGDKGCIQIFHISDGKLKKRESFLLNTIYSDEFEVILSFIKLHYEDVLTPDEIILPFEISDNSIIEWLSHKNSKIKTPKNTTEKELMKLAIENAKIFFDDDEILFELQKELSLKEKPIIIEAFDISNIGGEDAVGSCVVFKDGLPNKKKI